jgi:DNA-binding NtrC family response regulator
MSSQISLPAPILLVEDEGAVRDLLSQALANAGYAVSVAEDGEKALKIVSERDGTPFVLLTDVLMPGMNGHELAKEVVRLRPSVKIGFITGWYNGDQIKLGMCSNCRCILHKPFLISDLIRFVEVISSQHVCPGLVEDALEQPRAHLEASDSP